MTFEIILAFINYFGSGRLASRKQTNKLEKPIQNKMKKKPNQKKKYQLGVNIPVMYLGLMH